MSLNLALHMRRVAVDMKLVMMLRWVASIWARISCHLVVLSIRICNQTFCFGQDTTLSERNTYLTLSGWLLSDVAVPWHISQLLFWVFRGIKILLLPLIRCADSEIFKTSTKPYSASMWAACMDSWTIRVDNPRAFRTTSTSRLQARLRSKLDTWITSRRSSEGESRALVPCMLEGCKLDWFDATLARIVCTTMKIFKDRKSVV